MSGEALAIATARVALMLYVAALVIMAGAVRAPGRDRGASVRGRRLARLLWSAGLLAYLAHVVTAFQFVHGWSHQAAVVETARQTRELFGLETGVGIWFNYLFTAVWGADVAWWWLNPDSYARRAVPVSAGVHAFLAFMFFNGAVVFAAGPSRWIGLAATVVVPVEWVWRRRAMLP
jgi:hypothetical protein